jgi:nitronate monooxygenase
MADQMTHLQTLVGAIAPLRAKAESQNNGDFSPLWAGQNASGCKEMPAAQLTRELAGGL